MAGHPKAFQSVPSPASGQNIRNPSGQALRPVPVPILLHFFCFARNCRRRPYPFPPVFSIPLHRCSSAPLPVVWPQHSTVSEQRPRQLKRRGSRLSQRPPVIVYHLFLVNSTASQKFYLGQTPHDREQFTNSRQCPLLKTFQTC